MRCAALGVAALIVGVVWSSSILKFQGATVGTTGTIVGVAPRYDADGAAIGYMLIVRFEVAGREYTIAPDRIESSEPWVGSSVQVQYPSAAPEDARLGGVRLWTAAREISVGDGAVSFRLHSDGPIPLLVFGLLGIAAGMWEVLVPGRRRRRASRAIRGLRFDATVVGVRREDPSRRLPRKVTVERTDSAAGEVDQYVQTISRPPHSIPKVGSTAVVFVDPRDSRNYVVIPN